MLQAAHASVPWIVTPDDHEVFRVFRARGHQPEVHEKKTL
jgi:phosphodiesterase/alkaline phosphatase D-like protein